MAERVRLAEERWAFRTARASMLSILRDAVQAYAGAEAFGAGVATERAVQAIAGREDDVRALYETIYSRTLPKTAQRAFDALTTQRKGPEADVWLAAVRAFLRTQAGALIRKVTGTLISEVRRVLSAGMEAGEGIEQMRRRLERAVPGLARQRARAIAQTETLRASNLGAMEGARATGLRLEKEWLATFDGRTRDSHADANGQRRPLEVAFDVGGYAAMQPGDPSLPASESVGCRCTVVFIPMD